MLDVVIVRYGQVVRRLAEKKTTRIMPDMKGLWYGLAKVLDKTID